MWLLELLSNIGGLGTELGTFNLIVLAILGYLLRDRWKRIKAKIDPIYERDVAEIVREHDEMWEEYYRRKKNNESQEYRVKQEQRLAQAVADILKEKE
jgi:vacuolar-type H+-ATPase subunit E/Vma4